MTNILCLETSGLKCSVALSQNGDCVSVKSIVDQQYRHAEILHQLVTQVLETAQVELKNIDAVAVSMGPGSYTGLRVGVSAAKGFCYALEVPLIAISSLELIAREAQHQVKAQQYVAMIDARREEVFLQEFDAKLIALNMAKPVVFPDYTSDGKDTVFCGSGAKKAQNYFASPIIFLADIQPDAAFMCEKAYALFLQQAFENVAYFEPFYLKEFYSPKAQQ